MRTRKYLKGFLARLDDLAIRLCVSSGFLASAYYFLVNRRFDREHLAVLHGRMAHQQTVDVGRATSPRLRRCIHRLEKGLLMRPRRSVFAESFIEDAVRFYRQAADTAGYCPGELQWATDVLEEYFQVVGDSPIVSEARKAFARVRSTRPNATDAVGGTFKPYRLAEVPHLEVTFEQLHALYLRRRSVRWYEEKHVPLHLIQKAVDVATLAPSACNRQPFRYIITNDPRTAAKLARCAAGTGGFSQNLPALLVVIGDLSAFSEERDRHLIYIDAALASMQLMLAAETLGLSTCPINWPDVDEREQKMQLLLELPPHERVIMLIAIGYGDPDGQVAFSQKKSQRLIANTITLK